MSERIDLEEIARQTLGIAPANALERMQAERDAWRKHLERAEAEVAGLIDERNALQARLDACDMREIAGELRRIEAMPWFGREALRELIRRIDRESQEQFPPQKAGDGFPSELEQIEMQREARAQEES